MRESKWATAKNNGEDAGMKMLSESETQMLSVASNTKTTAK